MFEKNLGKNGRRKFKKTKEETKEKLPKNSHTQKKTE